jgi:DNA-binding transcriptional regulator YbjK
LSSVAHNLIDKVLLDTEGDALTPRGARKRSALLDAAFRIIVRDGPGAVTMRSVVAEASASHGAVNYYFGSTHALIREALKKVARQSIEKLFQTWKTVDAEACDPSTLARIISDHSFHDMIEDRKRGIIIYELHLAAARDPSLRPIIQAWGRGYTRIVRETLEKLGSLDPSADAALLVNLINGIVISQLALPRKDFADSILRQAVEQFLRNMRPPRS